MISMYLTDEEHDHVTALMDNGGAFEFTEPFTVLEYETMLRNVQYAGVKAGGRVLNNDEVKRLVAELFIEYHGDTPVARAVMPITRKQSRPWSHV